MFGKLIDLVTGKKPEAPEEYIARLTKLAEEEARKTAALKEAQAKLKKINDLQNQVLGERKAQTEIYSQMGVDNPQVQKSKRTRMYVFVGIAIVIILIVAKSCFK